MNRVGVLLIALVLMAGIVGCADSESRALAIVSTEGGSVTTPGEGVFTYNDGALVYLVATPDADYGFGSWTGNVSTITDVNEPATFITMSDNYFITANFELLANRPPTINSLTANATWVVLVESFSVTCNASDPNDDELSYKWTAPGAYITGTGPEVVCVVNLAGTCNITVLVEDGRGGSATSSLYVDVVPPALPIANAEVEQVIMAAVAYYEDTMEWPAHTGDCTAVGNSSYCFHDYYEGLLRASYHFDDNGFIDGVGDPGCVPTSSGTTSSNYAGIHWENPEPPTVGHGQWVSDY